MFTLKLYDRKHQELKLGDIVKISSCGQFTFYSEVKFLEKEKAIAPFHTFSFHSFEKVKKLPKNAVASTEERYRIWWAESPEADNSAADFENYLSEWRACEHILEHSCFTIEPKDG